VQTILLRFGECRIEFGYWGLERDKEDGGVWEDKEDKEDKEENKQLTTNHQQLTLVN
jgi:hypothetical protein